MLNDTAKYPETLKALPQWVLWKLETVNGRLSKIPYSALYHGRSSSTNPNTWTTFDNVWEVYCKNKSLYSGIGFVFTKGTEVVFIDIDHCMCDGVQDERAQYILSELKDNAFIEVSQSGTGLHLFTMGGIPSCFNNHDKHVEMYDTGRFCAMTGNVYSNNEPSNNSDALLRVYEKYKTVKEDKRKEKSSPPANVSLNLGDAEIIQRAGDNPISGTTFRQLFSGDASGYPSQSEADLRLCQILAFWCGRDFDTILRIVKSSGAYRGKWEREDYQIRTIQRACNSLNEDLNEFIQRKRREEAIYYETIFERYGNKEPY
ncbi:MAG: hypothetical protein K6E53_16750 [Lachnospiraceae bacterium]|nr:hypothetical protein [Lachnospiraceae bacterium]